MGIGKDRVRLTSLFLCMEMNVTLLLGLLIVAFSYFADSAPYHSWGSFANLLTLRQNNKTAEICAIGECVHWTKCPANATVSNKTKNCSDKPWGTWVCCLIINGSVANSIEPDHFNSPEFPKVSAKHNSSLEIWKDSSTESDWEDVKGIVKNGDSNSNFFRRRSWKTSPSPRVRFTWKPAREKHNLIPGNKNTKFVLKKTTQNSWQKPTEEPWRQNNPSNTDRKRSTSWSSTTKKPSIDSNTISTRWNNPNLTDLQKKSTNSEAKLWKTTSRSLVKTSTTSYNWNLTPIVEKRSTKIKKTTTTPRSWTKSRHSYSGDHKTTPRTRDKPWNADPTAPSWSVSTGKWSGRRDPSTRTSTVKIVKSTTTYPSKATTTSNVNSRQSSSSVPQPLPGSNFPRCGVRDIDTSSRRRGRRSDSIAYHPDSVPINSDSRNSITGKTFQRIVGGTEAEPYSWPWVAALYRVTSTGGNSFLSAGSLINENFVLTAAHVFTPEDLRSATFVVMMGTHTARESGAEHTVTSVLRHPGYERRFYYNDIALLKLARPVSFSNFVMPVCLPTGPMTDSDLIGKRVTVLGWGDESFGGITSRVLQETSFPIVSRRTCNASYVRVASNRFPRGITNNLLCAGDMEGGKDACQGDSGGPLTMVENGRYTQVGIVSFGYRCGHKDYPGVYTRVSSYLGWIEENAKCDDRPDYYDDYYSG